MKKIIEESIKYLGFATLDNVGRVFEYENEIYRGIYAESESFVREVFKSGLIDELVKANIFIETTLTDFSSNEFPLILKHKKITASLPTDWTFSMLKDAAQTILSVNALCNKYGYELHDSHPYNVSFDLSQAKWIDFGSIQKRTSEDWNARSEFINSTIVPLVFLAKNEFQLGYSLLLSEHLYKLDSKPFKDTIFFRYFLILTGHAVKPFNDISIDKEWIDKLYNESINSDSYWGSYQNDEASLLKDSVEHSENRFNRFFKLAELCNEYAPDSRTSLDLAGNMGLASIILSQHTKVEKFINIDYDTKAIDKSYKFLKIHPEFRTESYALNFMLPLSRDGISALKSDTVFALAITHHLLLTQGFKIDGILEKIKQYSKKYVFIEFMPLGMWGGNQEHKPNVPAWYTTEWFKAKFEQHFALVHSETIEFHDLLGKSEPHRVLFIGKV